MTKFRAVIEIDTQFDKLDTEEYLNNVVYLNNDKINNAIVTQIEVIEN